jgi:hypothetical protein
MNQAPAGESRMEIKSRNSDLCMRLSHALMTNYLLQAIAAMTRVRIQDPAPCKWKRLEPLGAYQVTGIMLLSNAISSLTTKSGGFVPLTKSIFRREKCSERSAWPCGRLLKSQYRVCFPRQSNGGKCFTHDVSRNRMIEDLRHASRPERRRLEACTFEIEVDFGYFAKVSFRGRWESS